VPGPALPIPGSVDNPRGIFGNGARLTVTVRPDPVRSAASGVIPSGICRSSIFTPAALTDPVRPGATSARAPWGDFRPCARVPYAPIVDASRNYAASGAQESVAELIPGFSFSRRPPLSGCGARGGFGGRRDRGVLEGVPCPLDLGLRLGLESPLSLVREQLADAARRVAGDSLEDIVEVEERIDPAPAATPHQAEHHCTPSRAVLVAELDPVVSAQSDFAQLLLDIIIVDFEAAVLEEPRKRYPVVVEVFYGPAEICTRQTDLESLVDPLTKLLHHGRRLLLAKLQPFAGIEPALRGLPLNVKQLLHKCESHSCMCARFAFR